MVLRTTVMGLLNVPINDWVECDFLAACDSSSAPHEIRVF